MKKLRLLDPLRDGRGVEKGEDTTPNVKFYFKQLGRKFWKLISINLIMLVQILPLLLCVIVTALGPREPVQSEPFYSTVIGAQFASPTSAGATLLSVFSSLNYSLPTHNTPIYWICGALLLIHVVTYGWQKVGSTYLMRNLVRGEGVFIISDFFYAIKKNFKQGFILGLLDCIFCGVLIFNIFSLNSMPMTAMNNFMYWATIAITIIYVLMRFYTYLLLVTFNIKITKIFKNSLIFTVLGIKRNLLASLWIILIAAVIVFLNILLFQYNIAVGIIIPFLFFLAVSAFTYSYAAYPVIQKYMIDPAPAPNKDESADDAEAAQ